MAASAITTAFTSAKEKPLQTLNGRCAVEGIDNNETCTGNVANGSCDVSAAGVSSGTATTTTSDNASPETQGC